MRWALQASAVAPIGEALEACEQQTEPTTPDRNDNGAAREGEADEALRRRARGDVPRSHRARDRSSDSAYLVWKLRQAQKGRIRVGPIERRAPGEAANVKVLPLRMTAAEVEALDEAWRRLGFKSRTAMIREAIKSHLGRTVADSLQA